MRATLRHLNELTAHDLMVRDVVVLPEEMLVRDAARDLLKNQVGGAPVVDSRGRCVGVLSAIDFLNLAAKAIDTSKPTGVGLPSTCGFQLYERVGNEGELVRCTLPAGVCPIQVQRRSSDGTTMLFCSQPHSVPTDWQVVQSNEFPRDEVRRFMTADPVMVSPDTPIQTLARMMIDAHIHRIIVVDDEHKPIGIVTSTNLLAALADL